MSGFVHGKDTVVIVDGHDLSLFTDNSSYEDGGDKHNTTAYGAERHAYDYGLGDGKLTISGTYENGTAGPRAVLTGIKRAKSKVTLIWRPEGTGTGLPQESVTVLVEKYGQTNPAADMIKWTADLQFSGDITPTTQ